MGSGLRFFGLWLQPASPAGFEGLHEKRHPASQLARFDGVRSSVQPASPAGFEGLHEKRHPASQLARFDGVRSSVFRARELDGGGRSWGRPKNSNT